MTNLFEETNRKICDIADKTWDDIAWIGVDDETLKWDFDSDSYITVPSCEFDILEFRESAMGIEYDEGYGVQEINEHLVIVFDDGSWLERAEYDGSEWWEYKTVPQRPFNHSSGASIKDMIYHP